MKTILTILLLLTGLSLLMLFVDGCDGGGGERSRSTKIIKWKYLGKTVSQDKMIQTRTTGNTITLHCTGGEVTLMDKVISPFFVDQDVYATEDGKWIKLEIK